MDTLIIFGASYLYLIVIAVAVIALFVADSSSRIKMLKLAVVSLPLAYLVGTGLGHVISSPRPFLVETVQPLIPSASDNGFPSDHTLLAATVAAIVFAYNRKWGVVLILGAVIVGIARVLAHVHHPLDVIGSLIIAFAITYIAYRFIVDRLPLAEQPNQSV